MVAERNLQACWRFIRAYSGVLKLIAAAMLFAWQLSAGSAIAADARGLPTSTGKHGSTNDTLQAVKRATRVVSLAPSNTELIYSIGGESDLVGVSTYCTFPAAAAKKPKMGSFIAAKLETLAKTKPDLVLLVSGQEPLKANLEKHGYHVRLLRNSSLADISANIRQLGELCGKEKTADGLAIGLEADIARLRKIVSESKPKRVFYCIWPKPIMTVGGNSFLDDVITACGGASIASGIKASYPKLSLERLISADPDVIILPAESRGSIDLESRPWSSLKAVRGGRYYYLPERADDYLSRPTLMIRKGLFWLASKIHPEKKSELEQWVKNPTGL